MQGIKQFPSLLFLLVLFSFGATAQSVSSITINPNPATCNTVLTATIQGLLPNPCYTVGSTFSVQGGFINLYLGFTVQSGVCTQVVTPFTQNIVLGIVPAGTYTVRCYSMNTGMQLCNYQQCVVSCAPANPCVAPTAGQCYATNITYNTIRLNCNIIAGAVYYQFLYRPVGYGYWYSTPTSTQNYCNIANLNPACNYEYCCRIYCNNGWTPYSPSCYCATVPQQPSGNSCTNAVVLTCGVAYSGTNNTGSNAYTSYAFPNGSVFTNMTGPESFHRFTVTSTSNVTVSLSGLSQNLHLFFLSNCNSNCNVVSGMGYSCNAGTNTEQMTVNNLAPGTYTIIVDGWQGAACNYSLLVQCAAVVTCSAPTSIQCYATNVTSNSIRLNCSAPGSMYNWCYRPTGSNTWIEVPNTTVNYCTIYNLQPGVSYQFIVAIRCSNVWSTYSPICYCTTPYYNPGTTCSTAIPATCGQTYTGNNGTGVYNYPYYTYYGQSTAESGPEVIYQITVPANTALTVGLSNLTADLDLFLLSSSSSSSVVARSGNSGSSNESLTANNLPAGTYYIFIDGWNNAISNFTLTINCNSSTGTCTNNEPCGYQLLYCNTVCVPVNCSNLGATTTMNPAPVSGCNSTNMQDVWYGVQMPSTGRMRVSTGAGTLTNLFMGIYGGSSCSYLNCYGCLGNTPGYQMPEVTITGTPGIWIYLRVWGYNGSCGTFSLCVTTLTNTSNLQAPDQEPTFAIDDNVVTDRDAPTDTPTSIVAGTYSLKVFPVPTRDEVNFSAQLPADKAVNIRVFDLNGRLVKEMPGLQSVDGNLLERMQVAELPTGLYIVKVRAGETELTSKFSKI